MSSQDLSSLWRRFWWLHIRRHDGEICDACGRPVDRSTGRSYWLAPDDLWNEVNGQFAGIRCVPCFTADAADRGVPIHWRAVKGV